MSKPDDTSKYYITYRVDIHPDGLTREEVADKGDVGATHNIFVVSVMHAEDGGLSLAFSGRDHKGEAITPEEEFKIWSLMAHRLANTLPDGGRKMFCSVVHEHIRQAILSVRDVAKEV